MAANQSIKELMAAETKASKIISEARQGASAVGAALRLGLHNARSHDCGATHQQAIAHDMTRSLFVYANAPTTQSVASA